MSRLHDPGPGELHDRLTILQLKLVVAWLEGRDPSQWAEEYHALTERFKHWRPVQDQRMELAAINAILWQREDDLRRLSQEKHPDQGWTGQVARTGLQIQKLNDRRAALVTLINANAGVTRGSDKL